MPLRSSGVAISPRGIAVTPDGTSVYAVNWLDRSVSEYDVNADGTLARKVISTISTGDSSTVPAGIAPLAIAVNPDGKAAYVANFGDGTVSQYDIGPGGALSPTIPATVNAGHFPVAIAVSV